MRSQAWWARAAGQNGAELVEAALVTTLLFSLLIGIIWVGRGYNIYATITRAAREGARFAVAPSCATCGNTYPTETEIRAVVDQALSASSLQTSAVADFHAIPVVLNPGSPLPDAGVKVSFSYPLQLLIPFTSVQLTNVSITTQVQMRQE